MVGFNANGDDVPPMILFPGDRLRDNGLSWFSGDTCAATKMAGWILKRSSNF